MGLGSTAGNGAFFREVGGEWPRGLRRGFPSRFFLGVDLLGSIFSIVCSTGGKVSSGLGGGGFGGVGVADLVESLVNSNSGTIALSLEFA